MPLQATSGAASYDAFGGGVPVAINYIEDVFSTWLYTGTGAAQTITNGIDLSGKGGMVWIKARSVAEFNVVVDTARGASNALRTSSTAAQINDPGRVSAFTSSGFTIGTDGEVSGSGNTHASWTFREQAKFFDVVTYTGNGATNREISHNLGSVPGSIFVKRTDTSGNWHVYHRSLPVDSGAPSTALSLLLNTTSQALDYRTFSNSTFQTSTVFRLGTANIADVNDSGGTYVAYLFAHNAGGFGLTGTDNVISCGSYTGNGSSNGPEINLGYEPQWLLVKNASGSFNWLLMDNMRGMPVSGNTARLFPDTSNAESTVAGFNYAAPTATGFKVNTDSSLTNASGATYIYIAIRRGPMKTPTTGTSVFDADTLIPAANLTGTKVTNPFAMDFLLTAQRDRSGLASTFAADRLRGGSQTLFTNATSAETNLGSTYNYKLDFNDGFVDNVAYPNGTVTTPMIYWSFRRAPGFFDEVCYTGTGADQRDIAHNLTSTPGFLIYKRTNSTSDWGVVAQVGSTAREFRLNTTAAGVNTGLPIQDWFATSTTFRVGAGWLTSGSGFNVSGATYVAYLFASCPGVSKVGSYTGNDDVQTINCGFTGGARFVMIKRTDAAEDWFVFDTARGINAGDDKILSLNTTAAEVTNRNNVSPASVGFEVNADGGYCNASGGTYIFLAIA